MTFDIMQWPVVTGDGAYLARTQSEIEA